MKHLKACAEQLPTQDCDSGLHARSNYELLALAQEHYIEYGKEYLPLIEANEKQMQVIGAAIRSVPDLLGSEVLRLRYMAADGCRPLPWKVIARELYGWGTRKNVKAAYRLHRAALEYLAQQITEAPQYEQNTHK